MVKLNSVHFIVHLDVYVSIQHFRICKFSYVIVTLFSF